MIEYANHNAKNDELLRAALIGLEHRRDVLVEQIGMVKEMLGETQTYTASSEPLPIDRPKRKYKFSAEVRKKMAEAQKRSWAERRREK
jgi:hypothetical protein